MNMAKNSYGVDNWFNELKNDNKKHNAAKKSALKTASKRKATKSIDIEDDEEPTEFEEGVFGKRSTTKRKSLKKSNKGDYKVVYNKLKRECKSIATRLGKIVKELKALK